MTHVERIDSTVRSKGLKTCRQWRFSKIPFYKPRSIISMQERRIREALPIICLILTTIRLRTDKSLHNMMKSPELEL